MKTRHLGVLLLSLCLGVASPLALAGHGPSGVIINGQSLSVPQLRQLEAQLGTAVAPGNYIVNWLTGCWANLSTGAQGCAGSQTVFSRHGSGSRDAQGNWNHYSRAAGGAVGGTADGCVYTTFGWSSC